MPKILNFLSLVCILLSCISIPNLTHGQCLSENDVRPIAADTDLSGIQDFNIVLFKLLSPKDPTTNFVFSPYSIWNALVLAYIGSSGETERQFKEVLRVSDKISTLRNWRELEFGYAMRPETSADNIFVMTNRAFFDNNVAIRSCMFGILPEELQQLDFTNDPAGSANTINKLVSETTRGHINELVSASVVDQARLVLVNAAFFKGNWASVFKPERTENRPFTPFSGQAVNIPTMAQFGPFKYGFDDAAKFDILELPYVGGQLAMYILRPYTEGQASFDGVINALTTATIDNVLKTMRTSQIHVFLPKFSLETRIDDELSSAIISMGLTDAFNEQTANFNDFSLDPNLFLRRGVHEAFLEINEEGTEAGAATAFIIDKIGGSLRFICDRPFIFLIRDNKTRNLLFMGSFKNPPKTQIPSNFQVDHSTHGINGQQDGVDNQQSPQNGFSNQQQEQQSQQSGFPEQQGQQSVHNIFSDQSQQEQQSQQSGYPEQQQQQSSQSGFSEHQQQEQQSQQSGFPEQQEQQSPQSIFSDQPQQEQQQIDFGIEPVIGQGSPTTNNNQDFSNIQQQQTGGIEQQTDGDIKQQPSDLNQEGTNNHEQKTTESKYKPGGFFSQLFKGIRQAANENSDEPSVESEEDSPTGLFTVF